MERISIIQGVERINGPGLMHYTGCGEDKHSTGCGEDKHSTGCGEDKHSTGCGEDKWAVADALYRVWRG